MASSLDTEVLSSLKKSCPNLRQCKRLVLFGYDNCYPINTGLLKVIPAGGHAHHTCSRVDKENRSRAEGRALPRHSRPTCGFSKQETLLLQSCHYSSETLHSHHGPLFSPKHTHLSAGYTDLPYSLIQRAASGPPEQGLPELINP